jgi:hypothetical protein
MTILRRAAPTRWLYPAILLLLFMEKASALEIADRRLRGQRFVDPD